jgi:phage FluMu protein Com
MSQKLWIEAGTILAVDFNAVVKCPDCSEADLKVFDTPAEATHVERHIRCPKCDAYNTLYKNINSN